jgi:hypothetical protein
LPRSGSVGDPEVFGVAAGVAAGVLAERVVLERRELQGCGGGECLWDGQAAGHQNRSGDERDGDLLFMATFHCGTVR